MRCFFPWDFNAENLIRLVQSFLFNNVFVCNICYEHSFISSHRFCLFIIIIFWIVFDFISISPLTQVLNENSLHFPSSCLVIFCSK